MANYFKKFFAVTLFIAPFISKGQPSIQWQKVLGGIQWESPTSFQKTSDGGYIVAGVAESKDGDVTGLRGGTDIWVIKLNSSGTIQWKKCYGGSNNDFSARIWELPGGDFIICGGTQSNNGDVKGNNGSKDAWIFRINGLGTLIWQRCIGGTKDDNIESSALASDGNILITFFSVSANGNMTGNHGQYDAFIGKIAVADGKLMWSRVLGGSADDAFYDIQPTTDGGCIATGVTYSNNGNISGHHGKSDIWIVKLKVDGTNDWSRVLGGSDIESGDRVLNAPDGGFFVAAYTNSSDGDLPILEPRLAVLMIKLSVTGNVENHHLQYTGTSSIYDLKTTPDGGVIIAHVGTLNADHVGPYNILHKFNANLEHEWIKEYGGANQDYLAMVQPMPDGGYVTYGYSASSEQSGYKGGYDIWIMKLDAAGSIEWESLFGGMNEEKISGNCIHHYHISKGIKNLIDEQGNIFFAASTYSNNTGDLSGTNLHYSSRAGLKPDIWVVKLNTEAISSPASVVNTINDLELNSIFFRTVVFPNPARTSVTISFTAIESAETTIEIYNIQGARVQTQKLGNDNKGQAYQYKIDVSNMSAGTYLYKVRNGNFKGIGKFQKLQ